MKKKQLVLLGSTGSIGTQTLQVVSDHPDLFEVHTLTAHSNIDLLIAQARKFHPSFVVVTDESRYLPVKEALKQEDVKVYAGMRSVCDVVAMPSVDMVLTALVGYAGLQPTIHAIKAGKTIALANKETLVVGGSLIGDLAQQHRVSILPVDSEHSAIFQCLAGESETVEKILLTASGGPFRTWSREQLAQATKADALKHPNWNMGAKITIDSASMMNKGFEVMEAKWLFGVEAEQIEVLVHPQSVVHSMVQFQDGAVKAQLGMPDMRLPIQYALGYPERLTNDYPRLDFAKMASLTFEQPDLEKFPNLCLAYETLHQGGNMPCVLNAANEVAVAAFLQDALGFTQMPALLEVCMQKATWVAQPTYEDLVETDRATRVYARELLGSFR